MSLIEVGVYFRVAVVGGRHAQGIWLVVALLLQVIWIPFWLSRQDHTSRAEAMIAAPRPGEDRREALRRVRPLPRDQPRRDARRHDGRSE